LANLMVRPRKSVIQIEVKLSLTALKTKEIHGPEYLVGYSDGSYTSWQAPFCPSSIENSS
jgi:hypothetical protein